MTFISHKSDVYMTFGERLGYARKQKKMTQVELGRLAGTSGDIIGKYERNENMPSIEMADKMAQALGVTLDYLVKSGEYEQIDQSTLKRLKEIEKFPDELKEKLYFFIDLTIRDYKARQAYSL